MTATHKTETTQRTDWTTIGQTLAARFAPKAAEYDANDSFVADNYAELKAQKIFSAGVPTEFGGGGATYAELCSVLQEIARGCGSTALALSMHTHLLAATMWKKQQGQPVKPLLERIARDQTVLISTGASDWLHSSGRAVIAEGGYRVNATKIFGSGSPAGDLMMTSACYEDPDQGPTVLHFPVPFTAEGVSVTDNWRTMGMRGTASNNIILEDVFVPKSAIVLTRTQGVWHPFFNVVCAVALPLIMSVYLGIAEQAARIAREKALQKKHDTHLPYLIGEMENSLTTAQMAVKEMVQICDNYMFDATLETANKVVIRKTIAANSCIQTVEKALEAVGGVGFFRSVGIERLLRDVHAAQFHPLPEKRQLHFSGSVAMNLEVLG